MRKRETLPAHYGLAIVEMHQRFYPVSLLMDTKSQELDSFTTLSWSSEDRYDIPYALGPRHTTGLVSFPTYAHALTFCHRRYEGAVLRAQWKSDATHCEVYPERNAWYAQEIQSLAGNAPSIHNFVFDVHAMVVCMDGTVYGVDAFTIDEAMAQLYERVSHHGSSAHTKEHPMVTLK